MSRPRQFCNLVASTRAALDGPTLDISSARHRIGARVDPREAPEYHECLSDQFWWTGVTLSSPPIGRSIRLSIARRMVADFVWAASDIGRVSVSRPVAFAI